MFSSFLKIAVLTFACAYAANAVEECHFNEYSNTKVVSDFSAVIIEVSSLKGCLSYLQRNKFSHKAAAYQASSGKCCTVLQDLNYTLEGESGWTAFEVREEVDTPNLNNILGLCPGRAVVLNKDQSVTLSVYSYNYSVCVVENLRNYSNGPDCIGSVTTLTSGLNFEYTIRYSTERNYDYIRLRSAYQDISYSGNSNASGILHGPTIFLSWITDNSGSDYGFCLTITATSKPVPPLPPATTQAPATSASPTVSTARTTRTPDGTEASRGICQQWNSTEIPPNGTVTLSIWSEQFDPCTNIASLTYLNNQSCNHVVSTEPGYTLFYYLTYNTEATYDILTLSYGGESFRYSGSGTVDDYVNYSSFLVNWRSDATVIRNGFCLRVTSVIETVFTNASVQGVCSVPNILVVHNYTRPVSVYSYDFDDCVDLSKLKNYAGNMFCISRLYVANNASDFEYEVNYQTQGNADFLSIYNNQEEIRFFGNGTRSGIIKGPILQLQWRTSSSLTGKGFCLRVRATLPRNDVIEMDSEFY